MAKQLASLKILVEFDDKKMDADDVANAMQTLVDRGLTVDTADTIRLVRNGMKIGGFQVDIVRPQPPDAASTTPTPTAS